MKSEREPDKSVFEIGRSEQSNEIILEFMDRRECEFIYSLTARTISHKTYQICDKNVIYQNLSIIIFFFIIFAPIDVHFSSLSGEHIFHTVVGRDENLLLLFVAVMLCFYFVKHKPWQGPCSRETERMWKMSENMSNMSKMGARRRRTDEGVWWQAHVVYDDEMI